jgi:hypothetical protein
VELDADAHGHLAELEGPVDAEADGNGPDVATCSSCVAAASKPPSETLRR